MLDYDLVRTYYYDPPATRPDRVPTDEELIARYERRRYDDCILRGGDPKAEGLGPHGSMIGGTGKPTTIHHTDPVNTTLLDPLPLSWWDYPRAQLRILPPGGIPAAHGYLADLSGAHLAGVLNRPSGPRLAQLFRSPDLLDGDRAIIAHLFGAIPAPRFYRLRTDGAVSLYEIARALHTTRTRRADLVRWINRFARRPFTVAGTPTTTPPAHTPPRSPHPSHP